MLSFASLLVCYSDIEHDAGGMEQYVRDQRFLVLYWRKNVQYWKDVQLDIQESNLCIMHIKHHMRDVVWLFGQTTE